MLSVSQLKLVSQNFQGSQSTNATLIFQILESHVNFKSDAAFATGRFLIWISFLIQSEKWLILAEDEFSDALIQARLSYSLNRS